MGLPAADLVDSATRALAPAVLVEITSRCAEQVRRGEIEVQADPVQRWHRRVYADDAVDVWVISWTRDQGTELHDHGGSSGAFTVVAGRVTETSWRSSRWDAPTLGAPGALIDHLRGAGESSAFGPGYVHDVRNDHEDTAVTVHAYSPPLSRMTYFDVAADRLVPRAEQWTDDPEAPAPARVSA